MPPDNDIKGTVHIYLYVDREEKEIKPIPVWCGTSDVALDSYAGKTTIIRTCGWVIYAI